jgi:anti-sigma B factor antagonist
VDLSIDILTDEISTVVALTGDLDIQTAPALRERLAALPDEARIVIVDLSAVEFLDSSGVGVLVGAAEECREAGRSLRLACPPPRVQKVFRISRLAEVIPIYDDVSEAAHEAS